jgi:pyruvate-formate lyase-activating enzyme
MRDYYCSEKFWWMHVNLEKRALSSCCSATHVGVDLEWLKQNPGNLFNHPSLVSDRQQMMQNIPCASCTHTCWSQEDKGLESKRTLSNSNARTHTEIYTRPEILNIHVGSSCNMSCVYCGTHSSTTWANDLVNNGDYGIDDSRFEITTKDTIVLKLGQKAITGSNSYLTMLEEVKKYNDAASMDLTGGEPLLHNNLETILDGFQGRIRIHTGLGVDTQRLEKILNKLPRDRVNITVSVENIGELYEFNRFGNSYERLLRNIALVEKFKLPITLRSTLSNLTIFGFKDFLDSFETYNKVMYPCLDVPYLGLHVLDSNSKHKILDTDYKEHTEYIHKAVREQPTVQDTENLKRFVTEFAARRKLTLGIFPESFRVWILQ